MTETETKASEILTDFGPKKDDGVIAVDHIVAYLRDRIGSSKLAEGSSKAIRKAMEAMEGVEGTWSGSEKKQIVMTALQIVSTHAPEKWQATLGVASEQINDLAKAAKGLTKINGNMTLSEVKEKVDLLLTASHGIGVTCGCWPKKTNKKKNAK